MKKRFSAEQIIGFLREADAGLPIKELCRKHGFSDASYYLWHSKFGGMTVSDARRLKDLETENARLKKLLAENDNYACEASDVANNIGMLSAITNVRLESLISSHLPTCEINSETITQKMEEIREALAAARVRQLDVAGADPNYPVTVTGQSIADFHNSIFQSIGGGTRSFWGLPIFGGDLQGSNALVHWCASPACQP